MKNKGRLFLIPNTLGLVPFESCIPTNVTSVIQCIDTYIAEHAKEGRRLLKRLQIEKPLDQLAIFELNKHTPDNEKRTYLDPVLEGKDIGLISDAGCPGIADPGAEIVTMAHTLGIQVVPLVGPSSILLALISSGFNGQHFVFHGYLSKDRRTRIQQLKKMEAHSQKLDQTQLFIETPYRNNNLIEDVLQHCKDETRFCIAANLTLENEFIGSKSIQDWKKQPKDFHKQPAVFLLYSQ